jgi:dynein heavy chain
VAERWGLCIDPQMQANKWIKNKHKQEKMTMIKFGKSTFLREISAAVNNGCPVLVEDVLEHVDPGLDPILCHSEFMGDGGIKQIKLGESTQDYDDDFKLYMTTKLPNPHYPPEICIKVTLINFTVTFEGLEEQLLGDVVVKEKPEVEKQRDQIVIQMAADKKTLQDIEKKILKMLSESTEEQILDEDTLIDTLEESNVTSTEINERIAEASIVEVSINETRMGYKTVAIRGSLIYFVIADMSRINDMYQNSLQFVKVLFNKAIDQTEKSDNLEERLGLLIEKITRLIFSNISRGLFEKDKLIYSFLICTSIDRFSKKIQPNSWNLLLRGTATITDADKKKQPENPMPINILTDLMADFIWSAEVTEPDVYGGLFESFAEN